MPFYCIHSLIIPALCCFHHSSHWWACCGRNRLQFHLMFNTSSTACLIALSQNSGISKQRCYWELGTWWESCRWRARGPFPFSREGSDQPARVLCNPPLSLTYSFFFLFSFLFLYSSLDQQIGCFVSLRDIEEYTVSVVLIGTCNWSHQSSRENTAMGQGGSSNDQTTDYFCLELKKQLLPVLNSSASHKLAWLCQVVGCMVLCPRPGGQVGAERKHPSGVRVQEAIPGCVPVLALSQQG